jgi:hypothetical protein
VVTLDALMLRRQRAEAGTVTDSVDERAGRIVTVAACPQQIVRALRWIVARDRHRQSRPLDVDTVEALEELLISADLGWPRPSASGGRDREARRRRSARRHQAGNSRRVRGRRSPGLDQVPRK